MNAQQVLVLGGGFGGIAAANTLRGLLPPEHAIVVVDQSAHFYVGAGKTWIMLGERSFDQISCQRADLLDSGVGFLQADVQHLDLEGRTARTGTETLHWDYLVIALGADLNNASIPGLVQAGAHTFYSIEGAERLKDAVEQFQGGDVVILIPKVPFKCPPAPYEAAMLLHEAFMRRGLADDVRLAIYTVEGAPMATAGPEMGQFIKSQLAQRGIGYHPQLKTAFVDGAGRHISFEDGTEARYDLLIAIPPHEAPKVIREAQLVNPSGWIPVDPHTLAVKSAAEAGRVYAVGDITSVPLPGHFKPNMPLALPKAGVFATAHGEVVAHQIAASILGTAPAMTFDGKGYCFLETGGGRAVKAEGSFFDLPHPTMHKRVPDAAQLQAKVDWVARLLKTRR